MRNQEWKVGELWSRRLTWRVGTSYYMFTQSILQITDTKIPVFPNILEQGPVFAMGTIGLD